MTTWESIKDLWPFAAIVGMHVARTEVTASKVRGLERRQDRDMNDIKDMHREIREDIKSLIRRDTE